MEFPLYQSQPMFHRQCAPLAFISRRYLFSTERVTAAARVKCAATGAHFDRSPRDSSSNPSPSPSLRDGKWVIYRSTIPYATLYRSLTLYFSAIDATAIADQFFHRYILAPSLCFRFKLDASLNETRKVFKPFKFLLDVATSLSSRR